MVRCSAPLLLQINAVAAPCVLSTLFNDNDNTSNHNQLIHLMLFNMDHVLKIDFRINIHEHFLIHSTAN